MNASLKRGVMVAAAVALLLAAYVLPAGAQQPSTVSQAQGELMVAQLPGAVEAQPEQPERAGGEAALVLPPLDLVDVGGYNGRTLLMWGLGVSLLGMIFGLVILTQLKNLPVHRSMREISELIYETCKTYLVQQGKFLAILEVFIAVIIVLYFGVLSGMDAQRVLIILLFSVVGILGSYGVAWFGIRVNTYANSRTAFASLTGKPYSVSRDSAQGGHERRHAAHQRRAAHHAVHPPVRPG